MPCSLTWWTDLDMIWSTITNLRATLRPSNAQAQALYQKCVELNMCGLHGENVIHAEALSTIVLYTLLPASLANSTDTGGMMSQQVPKTCMNATYTSRDRNKEPTMNFCLWFWPVLHIS